MLTQHQGEVDKDNTMKAVSVLVVVHAGSPFHCDDFLGHPNETDVVGDTCALPTVSAVKTK